MKTINRLFLAFMFLGVLSFFSCEEEEVGIEDSIENSASDPQHDEEPPVPPHI